MPIVGLPQNIHLSGAATILNEHEVDGSAGTHLSEKFYITFYFWVTST